MPRTRDGHAARFLHTVGHAFHHGADVRAGNHHIDFPAFHLAGIVAARAGQRQIGLIVHVTERRTAAHRRVDAERGPEGMHAGNGHPVAHKMIGLHVVAAEMHHIRHAGLLTQRSHEHGERSLLHGGLAFHKAAYLRLIPAEAQKIAHHGVAHFVHAEAEAGVEAPELLHVQKNGPPLHAGTEFRLAEGKRSHGLIINVRTAEFLHLLLIEQKRDGHRIMHEPKGTHEKIMHARVIRFFHFPSSGGVPARTRPLLFRHLLQRSPPPGRPESGPGFAACVCNALRGALQQEQFRISCRNPAP